MHEPTERELQNAAVFLRWAFVFGGTKLAIYLLLRQVSKWAKD
jgi:hypothetical protein